MEETKKELEQEVVVTGHRLGSPSERGDSPALSIISGSSPEPLADSNITSPVHLESNCDHHHAESPSEPVDATENCADTNLDCSIELRDAFPPDPEELIMSSSKLDSRGKIFVKELYNIDKDIPRCDRDYW